MLAFPGARWAVLLGLGFAVPASGQTDAGVSSPVIRLIGMNRMAGFEWTVAMTPESDGGIRVETTFASTRSRRSPGTYQGHLDAAGFAALWQRLEERHCWQAPTKSFRLHASSGRLLLDHEGRKDTVYFAGAWDVVAAVEEAGHIGEAKADYRNDWHDAFTPLAEDSSPNELPDAGVRPAAASKPTQSGRAGFGRPME